MVQGSDYILKVLDELANLMLNPEHIVQTIAHMEQLLVLKGGDYSAFGHAWNNFETAASVAGASIDTVIMVLIGIKLGRIQNLLRRGESANFESLDDSWQDLLGYITLLMAYKRFTREQPNEIRIDLPRPASP
jgi:hypothetical protein